MPTRVYLGKRRRSFQLLQVNGQLMAMFYADVDVAKDQLKAAKGQNLRAEGHIQPFGLGAAQRLPLRAATRAGIVEPTAADAARVVSRRTGSFLSSPAWR